MQFQLILVHFGNKLVLHLGLGTPQKRSFSFQPKQNCGFELYVCLYNLQSLKATMPSTWAYWQKPYLPGTYFCEAWIFNKANKQNIFAEANGVPWCSFTVIYNGGILVESGSVSAKAVFADDFCAECLLGHSDVFTVLLQPLLVESAPLQWKPATRAQFRCLRGHSMFKTFVCPLPPNPNPQEFHGIPSIAP